MFSYVKPYVTDVVKKIENLDSGARKLMCSFGISYHTYVVKQLENRKSKI
jgi:hypothetical protein